MKKILLCLCVLVFQLSTFSQSKPSLQTVVPQYALDETYTADNQVFYFRSGSNINLPLTEGATLKVGLDANLSTEGMVGIEFFRNLPLRSSISTPYAQVYSQSKTADGKDIVVETKISGHKSGMIKQSTLLIEPKTFYISIDGYLRIGEKNGKAIYLKPGRWKIDLRCTFKSIENSNGKPIYAKNDEETVIKGKKFGFEQNLSDGDDKFGGLLYINNVYGSVAYGLTKISGLFGFFFKRPNIKLPASSEVYFKIEKMQATYISPPLPKSQAVPYQQ